MRKVIVGSFGNYAHVTEAMIIASIAALLSTPFWTSPAALADSDQNEQTSDSTCKNCSADVQKGASKGDNSGKGSNQCKGGWNACKGQGFVDPCKLNPDLPVCPSDAKSKAP